MSNVWFTSDLHIGHGIVAAERMRRLNGSPATWSSAAYNYGPSIDSHDLELAQNWDAIVKPDDMVWVLGDISAGGSAAQERALSWITQRPGWKHLITGNHDGCHPMHRDAHKWQFRYLMQAFESVQPFARRRINGRPVLLSHFPYIGDHTTEQRFNQYRLRDEGEWLLHGHTHGVSRWASWRHTRQIHVGVDAWGLGPVALDEIATLMDKVS